MTAGQRFVEGHYPWPFDGDLRRANTALMLIDLQVAYCGQLTTGVDAVVARSEQVLRGVRDVGFHVLFTRRGYRADLSDLPRAERWRSERRGTGPDPGILLRGQSEWEITPELAPRTGEPIIDKSSMTAFYATDLEQVLHRSGIRNLIIAGLFTDGSIQATLRDANDRGFECLILEDCCAAVESENHTATIRMLKLLCGLYGSVSRSEKLLEVLI